MSTPGHSGANNGPLPDNRDRRAAPDSVALFDTIAHRDPGRRGVSSYFMKCGFFAPLCHGVDK